MTIGVYMIEHTATGRKYVGKSVNVEVRLRAHFAPREGLRKGRHLYRAIAKYGRDAFTCSLLEECRDDATAIERERFWIRELNSRSPGGFNLTEGGEGPTGLRHSDATRAKLSAASLGNRHSLGRPVSDETRAKRSRDAMGNRHCVGRVLSAETKAKIGAASRARIRAKGN